MSRNMPRRMRVKSKAIDPTRIGQLLRLALSSDQAGEVTSAVAALKRTLKASGLDLHDVVDAVEAGLSGQLAQQQHARQATWGPPSPRGDDWQSMCWYCHHHRHQLRPDQKAWIADMLLGLGDGFDDGRLRGWAIQDLRQILAGLDGTR